MTRARTLRFGAALIAPIVLTVFASSVAAQHDHMDLWSTEPGGGEIVLAYDFDKRIQVFESFCAQPANMCLYTTINPAFLAPEEDEPDDGFSPIDEGTRVSIEIVAIDAALTLNINGNRLNAAGKSATLGTMPFHTHPSWQLLVPGGELGEYHISYKLKTDSTAYQESQVFSNVITNILPTPDGPTPTPTPTATPTPGCPGDCGGDGAVTIDEIVMGVAMALGDPNLACGAFDMDQSGTVTVDELLLAVNSALAGCPATPTPIPVTFDEIQDTIFTPSCLSTGCHNARDHLNDLVLEEGAAYNALVGVTPNNFAAQRNGLFRVDPHNPDNSFLLTKLQNPRPEYGSTMPLNQPPLSADQIQLIRNWILQGAKP